MFKRKKKTKYSIDTLVSRDSFAKEIKRSNSKEFKKRIIWSLIFNYAMKIKTQLVRIKEISFRTRRMALISTVVFLVIGSVIFFTHNYFARGATYGWTQTTWNTLTANTATHPDDGTWDEYSAADANLDFTSDGQVSIAPTTANVNIDFTTEGDFVQEDAISGTDFSGGTIELSSSFTCGDNLAISHTAGVVAPVTKAVTYGTVVSSLSGSSKCWITRNLGASRQAISATDATESSAGWYW